MQWNTRYSRKSTTDYATGNNGRRYEAVSTGLTNPVRVYQLGPQPAPKGRKPKRVPIGQVPNLALARLAAEETERIHRNGDLHGDANTREREQNLRLHEQQGEQAVYLLSVPASQMLTAQICLEATGIGARLDFHRLVLQPHMIGEAWQASLAMGLPGPSLMSPSPSGPPQRKAIILGALPQQPA